MWELVKEKKLLVILVCVNSNKMRKYFTLSRICCDSFKLSFAICSIAVNFCRNSSFSFCNCSLNSFSNIKLFSTIRNCSSSLSISLSCTFGGDNNIALWSWFFSLLSLYCVIAFSIIDCGNVLYNISICSCIVVDVVIVVLCVLLPSLSRSSCISFWKKINIHCSKLL